MGLRQAVSSNCSESRISHGSHARDYRHSQEDMFTSLRGSASSLRKFKEPGGICRRTTFSRRTTTCQGDIPPMELSASGTKGLGRGGGCGTWPALGLPRAHSIQSQITTLILHREMVQVNHLVLTAVLCMTAAIRSTHRELKRLVQRHTAVNAEHAFLCEQVYPGISSTHIVRMPGTCPEELSGWEETNL